MVADNGSTDIWWRSSRSWRAAAMTSTRRRFSRSRRLGGAKRRDRAARRPDPDLRRRRRRRFQLGGFPDAPARHPLSWANRDPPLVRSFRRLGPDREPDGRIVRDLGRTHLRLGGNVGLRRDVWYTVGGFDESFPAGAEEIDSPGGRGISATASAMRQKHSCTTGSAPTCAEC